MNLKRNMQSLMSPDLIFNRFPLQQQNNALNLMQLHCETNMLMMRGSMGKCDTQILVQIFMKAA